MRGSVQASREGDYQLFYAGNLEAASAAWEKDIGATVRALFRAGSPEDVRRPAFTAGVRARGGFFGPGAAALSQWLARKATSLWRISPIKHEP